MGTCRIKIAHAATIIIIIIATKLLKQMLNKYLRWGKFEIFSHASIFFFLVIVPISFLAWINDRN